MKSLLFILVSLCALAAAPIYRISLGGGSGGVSPGIVSSGDWTGFSTSSTVSAGSRTLTGTGTIKFVVTVTGCSAKYSYNGGSFTTFTNGATLAVTNGTLALEITGSGSGSECIGTIVDNSNSATIGNVDIENTL